MVVATRGWCNHRNCAILISDHNCAHCTTFLCFLTLLGPGSTQLMTLTQMGKV